MLKCTLCTTGPKGTDGHLDLFVTTMTGGAMQFKCRTCGTVWLRQAGVWSDATGKESGATVPRSAKNDS
jgi:hypothetical protein